jgi:membrane-associated protease RseP (regulator of RpoE activity)
MNDLGFRRLVGVAVVGASLCWDLPAQDTARESRPDTTLIQDVNPQEGTVRVSTRWIGVVCSPADDLLRAHLDLPETAGLVVQSVIPGSPAEQAGLKQYDILTTVDGNPLTGLEQLVEAVEASDGNAMEFTWVRKGEEITKSITPAKRPSEMKWSPEGEGSGWAVPEVDAEALQKWVDKLKRDPNAKQPFELRFFGPGIAPGEESKEFTGSLSVEINKQEDEPARIKVRRGDESWEVTEDTLDELPSDLKGHVQSMLGRGGRVGVFQFRADQLPQHLREFPAPHMTMPPNIQQQFDEMNRRMEEMLKELHELRQDDDSDEDEGVDA